MKSINISIRIFSNFGNIRRYTLIDFNTQQGISLLVLGSIVKINAQCGITSIFYMHANLSDLMCVNM